MIRSRRSVDSFTKNNRLDFAVNQVQDCFSSFGLTAILSEERRPDGSLEVNCNYNRCTSPISFQFSIFYFLF